MVSANASRFMLKLVHSSRPSPCSNQSPRKARNTSSGCGRTLKGELIQISRAIATWDATMIRSALREIARLGTKAEVTPLKSDSPPDRPVAQQVWILQRLSRQIPGDRAARTPPSLYSCSGRQKDFMAAPTGRRLG